MISRFQSSKGIVMSGGEAIAVCKGLKRQQDRGGGPANASARPADVTQSCRFLALLLERNQERCARVTAADGVAVRKKEPL